MSLSPDPLVGTKPPLRMNSASPLGEAKTVARAMNSNRVVTVKVVATVLMMTGVVY